MKVRVTFEISPVEKARLQKIIGKDKGVEHEEYKHALKRIVKDKLFFGS